MECCVRSFVRSSSSVNVPIWIHLISRQIWLGGKQYPQLTGKKCAQSLRQPLTEGVRYSHNSHDVVYFIFFTIFIIRLSWLSSCCLCWRALFKNMVWYTCSLTGSVLTTVTTMPKTTTANRVENLNLQKVFCFCLLYGSLMQHIFTIQRSSGFAIHFGVWEKWSFFEMRCFILFFGLLTSPGHLSFFLFFFNLSASLEHTAPTVIIMKSRSFCRAIFVLSFVAFSLLLLLLNVVECGLYDASCKLSILFMDENECVCFFLLFFYWNGFGWSWGNSLRLFPIPIIPDQPKFTEGIMCWCELSMQ